MTARLRCRQAALAGMVVVLGFVAGCSGPRSGASVTGEVSGCAAVLPLANRIVHDRGELTLVRRISKSEADALSRQLGVRPPAPSPAPPHSHVRSRRPHRLVSSKWPKACLIVYHGDYPPGTITGASPPAVSGHYVLIVLRIRHPVVDRILVGDRLPRS
ncbi:MAG: hypothetical protein ACRDQX_06770 [Pseudonocardiaceae bacterium]